MFWVENLFWIQQLWGFNQAISITKSLQTIKKLKQTDESFKIINIIFNGKQVFRNYDEIKYIFKILKEVSLIS